MFQVNDVDIKLQFPDPMKAMGHEKSLTFDGMFEESSSSCSTFFLPKNKKLFFSSERAFTIIFTFYIIFFWVIRPKQLQLDRMAMRSW